MHRRGGGGWPRRGVAGRPRERTSTTRWRWRGGYPTFNGCTSAHLGPGRPTRLPPPPPHLGPCGERHGPAEGTHRRRRRVRPNRGRPKKARPRGAAPPTTPRRVSPPPGAPRPRPRRHGGGGGEQTGKRIKQRVGGRRRPRHRLGHTHPTRPPRPTLSPLRCVTVAPERGGGADERQRGGEGHTQRQWTIRAGRGAPPADDARFLAGGCGGQQTRTGRPQQRAPVGPTPTTTRPSSRNWPTRPAPTVVRRCGIGSPLPRIAGRPADATGGGGGAGYNVCAPGGEPRVPAAPSPTKQAGRVNVGRRQPPSPRQPKDRAGAAPLPPPAVVALRAVAAQSGAGTSGAGGGGGGVNLDWPVTRHATVVCRRAPDGRGRAAGELCGPNSAGAAAAEREPPDDHRTVPHPAREWGEPWRHEWLTGGPTAAAVGVGGTERAAGGHLGSFNPLGCGASTAVVLSTFSCVFGVWARSGSFGNWCLRTMYRACTCC